MTNHIANEDAGEDARLERTWRLALAHYDGLCGRHGIDRDQIDLSMEPRPHGNGWAAAVWAAGPLLGRFENMVTRGAYEDDGDTTEFHRQADIVVSAILRRTLLADFLGLDLEDAWRWEIPEEHVLVHPFTLRFGPRHPELDVHGLSTALRTTFECDMDVAGSRLPYEVLIGNRKVCRIQTTLSRSWMDVRFDGGQGQRENLVGLRLREVSGTSDLPRCTDEVVNAIVDDLVVEEVDHYPAGPDAGRVVRLGMSRTTWLPYRSGAGADAPAGRYAVVA
jgi:hypothetical protein